MIYDTATGQPRVYSDPTILAYYYCTYDDRGDVFVLGYGDASRSVFPVFAELRKGASKFLNLLLDRYIDYPQKVQWDGKYVTLNLGNEMYRVVVEGSNAKVVGTTTLQGDENGSGGIAWIAGDTVIDSLGDESARHLGIWPYPAGGQPTRRTRQVEKRRVPIADINLGAPRAEPLPGSPQVPSEK